MTNVTFQTTTLATPPNATVVETVAGVASANRQVVTIADAGGNSVDSIGGLTETAPATDTASSGLNGRLQRVAQRLTSLIALLPTALGAGGGIKVDGSGTALPVSGTVTANAGSNLNTSTLALETGGNLATLAGAVSGAKVQDNIAQFGGSNVVTGTGASGSGIPRVTVSNDSTVVTTGRALLWNAGSGNNGLVTSALTLMTTELKGLTSASVIVSSVGGSSGLFTNSNTGQGQWADLYYYAGNAAGTPTTVGGGLTGWFLTSLDGSAFEPNSAAPARAPDFFIPLPTGGALSTSTSTVYKSNGRVMIPALNFYVLIQNNCGATLGAGSTTAPFIKAGIYGGNN